MNGCQVKPATRLVMQNHFYNFDNQIRKQQKGGAIGKLDGVGPVDNRPSTN